MEYIDKQRTSSSKPGKSQKKKAGIFGKSLVLFLGALITVLLLNDRITDDDTEVVSLKPDASFSFLKQNRLLSAEQIEPGADFPSKEQQIVRWLQSSQEISLLKRGRSSRGLRIALFNIPNPDTELWKSFSGRNELVNLDQVLDSGSSDNITWSAFFPKDVDRDEDVQAARCPSMQLPEVRPITRPDLVVASLSCEAEGSGSRDIRYLRDSVSIALLAASTGYESVHVLLHGTCRPVPNIFKCNELVDHESGLFQLYKLDLDRIRRLLKLPIGSCRAVMPSMVPDTKQDDKKQAYVTIIHSVKAYVCGAIMLAHSIRRSGSTRDLVLLVDKNIKLADKRGLEAAGWKVTCTERIRNPKAKTKAYNEWNYSKFRLWQLTDYDKIIFLDSDVIVTRNMDFLFGMPELSASRNHDNVFNSGVMVVEPSLCTFKFLVDNMDKIVSYNGGDQGYLNEVFTWWHRLPLTMNFLKFFDNDIAENKRKVRLLTEEEGNNATVYVKHFLGTKPWLCHRDHDCNWYDKRYLRGYANDEVHAHWWKLHDKMPPKLQGFCKMSMSRRDWLDRQIAKARTRQISR